MSNEKLYTVKEVAERFRCSDQTIRRMIKREEIDIIRIGGEIRIKESEVKRILKEK
jgi:excisionase family DNA binding protein